MCAYFVPIIRSNYNLYSTNLTRKTAPETSGGSKNFSTAKSENVYAGKSGISAFGNSSLKSYSKKNERKPTEEKMKSKSKT